MKSREEEECLGRRSSKIGEENGREKKERREENIKILFFFFCFNYSLH